MELARVNSMTNEFDISDKMVEDWVGNTKGMFQIIWVYVLMDKNIL